MAAAKVKNEPEQPKIETAELVKASYDVFGVTPEVMRAALKGVDAVTVDEAKVRVKSFLSKGVK